MPKNFNSSPPGQNGHHFTDNIFQWIFLNKDVRISIQLHSMGSGNALSPVQCQAITLTNAVPVHWGIYAALGGDELS